MLQIAAGKGSNTRMILSITPNPALDRTLVVPRYGEGGVFRPQQQIAGAGGKGINVARAAVALGSEATALGFLAGHTGKLFAEFSEREHIKSRWTWLHDGETRTCIVLLDPGARRTSVINEFGPPASAEDWHALQADALLEAKHASTICVCGSLPAGSPINAFRTLIAALRDTGKPVWADTSGAALDAALMPGVNIKISHDEAAELLGTPIETAEEAAQATEELSRRIGGAKAIIIKAVVESTTNYTVLDVNEGTEKREADAYISAYAKGGKPIGEFSSQAQALDKAFELCPEG